MHLSRFCIHINCYLLRGQSLDESAQSTGPSVPYSSIITYFHVPELEGRVFEW